MRVHEAGDAAIVADLEAVIDPAVNARAIGIAAAVRAQRIAGVRDVVSTFHSVAIYFDPLVTEGSVVQAALRTADTEALPSSTGRTVQVPVTYGGESGPDLVTVAGFAGCSMQEVVWRHTSRAYRVYMLGFLPGYPYMGIVDETIAAPRRPTPRVRVAAGAVGIAGRQTGIYPRESPGGWQIIGRTSLTLFDPEATPPALFAPGDEVRFVPVADEITNHQSPITNHNVATRTGTARFVTVLHPGLQTTIQDEGRWGYQYLGVPVGGPMDLVAHRLANAVLGNAPDAATLEAALLGPELRVEHDTWIALAGADLQPTIDGRDASMGVPIKCRPGSVLRFSARRSGARVYIAADGGIAAPLVLGSRATHLLSGLGGIEGRALRAGDRLVLGSASGSRRANAPGLPGEPDRSPRARHGQPPSGARLRILPGPQIDHFAPSAFDALQHGRYTVSPQSDRMGYRLSGARISAPAGEMISNAVFMGGLQVPPSGDPILLMADRQTTGGYPQLAIVITADLPLAAQLVPGDWIEFQACSRSDALAALRAQEGLRSALG